MPGVGGLWPPSNTGIAFLVGAVMVAVYVWILRSSGRGAESRAAHAAWQAQARLLLPFAIAFLVLLLIGYVLF